MIAWIALFLGPSAMAWPVARAIHDARPKRLAIRLHALNWTHGQIAEELGREPSEVAGWLDEADRTGAV